VTRYALGRARCHKPLYVETPLWPDVEPHRPDLTVDDHEAVDTGLVTRTGEIIWRLPEPMGFRK
jgi:hypothetical protein